MSVSTLRAPIAALAGALVGATGLAIVQPATVSIEMDRSLPALTSGFYPVERTGDLTFAWTAAESAVTFAGLDRQAPWTCTLRFRGGRPHPHPQPNVTLSVDGVVLASRTPTNEYEDLNIAVPPGTGDGLTLAILSHPAFVPSPADPRRLGIQVDRLACQPAGSIGPPRDALVAAAVGAGAVAAALAVTGVPTIATAIGTVALAAPLVGTLATGTAPYSPAYLHRAAIAAIAIAVLTALAGALAGRWRRQPLSREARYALWLSAGVLLAELLALFHPSKLPVDAIFHAHRLEGVLNGQLFFTQPMPDGVRFPYAIALYVVAAPWTFVATDFVALLRVVTCASHVVAGLLLYPVVVRAWDDRRAGVLAVGLYHAVPIPLVVIGNANLTFAFGSAAALAAIAAAAAWRFPPGRVLPVAGLCLLAALAFLSHVGVFPVLLTTLIGAAVLYRWRGPADFARPARVIALATAVAAVLSVVTYYGRFDEAYRSLDRVRARVTAAAPSSDRVTATTDAGTSRVRPSDSRSLAGRFAHGIGLGVRAIGWPLVVLATAGAWLTWPTGARDRLALVVAAMAATFLLFLAGAVAAPVEPRFQRYTDEFIQRLSYAVAPAVVLLAARGGAWALASGVMPRVLATLVILAATLAAAREWVAWLA